ncbi:hypothetical protein DK847_13765 [Aestuariivirga litoralis]|uniref:BON domain-containing protein n=1 Tax=Aestuariivirga litoralis TaxID=2650924 RepID=A0A2W2BJ98_9HYPH|nr:hypothetical protein [Aestuariivirga litoralis]PZF76259.1 hypothetical protein DK847_13765 [Aestuariivirga litoralis]
MKRFAVTPLHVDDHGAAIDSPWKLRNLPVMDESTVYLRPLRWIAFLPLALLPFLAAAALQGPRLEARLQRQLQAELAAAGQGWAEVTVRGRDVEMRGLAPDKAAAASAAAVAAASFGVRRLEIRTGTAR